MVVDLLPDPLYLVDKIFDGDSFLGRLHSILLDPSDLHLVEDRNQQLLHNVNEWKIGEHTQGVSTLHAEKFLVFFCMVMG